MRVVVAGSRACTDEGFIWNVLEWHKWNWLEIPSWCSGGAKGVDTIAEDYLTSRDYDFTRFDADWNLYGKPAGFIRNRHMIEWALEDPNGLSVLIAILEGVSKGTRHTINLALDLGVTDIHVYRPEALSRV